MKARTWPDLREAERATLAESLGRHEEEVTAQKKTAYGEGGLIDRFKLARLAECSLATIQGRTSRNTEMSGSPTARERQRGADRTRLAVARLYGRGDRLGHAVVARRGSRSCPRAGTGGYRVI